MDAEGSRIPILRIEDFLVASVQMALHDRAAMQFKDDLLQRIHETKARGLIMDLTALDIVDSFIAKLIGDIAEMAALMGTKVVVTGLQPAVAVSLVELGVELRGVITALNLEKGIKILRTHSLDAPGKTVKGSVRADGARGGAVPRLSGGRPLDRPAVEGSEGEA
jgi:rsbT antagonist protein RsbS